MAKINWMHISDLHMDKKGIPLKWPNIKNEFFDDVLYVIDQIGEPLDIILFSGDLTKTGAKDEFDQLEIFLEELNNKMFPSGDSSKFPILLAVPGNHDLDRNIAKKSEFKPVYEAISSHCGSKNFSRVSELLFENKSSYMEFIRESFSNYSAWWSRKKKPDKYHTSDILFPGDFSTTIHKDGFSLGIVGLNSAFLQLDSANYYNGLAIYEEQFHAVCPNNNGIEWCKQHDLCFLMTHHPSDWFDQYVEKDTFTGVINTSKNFKLHLFGHMHDSNMNTTSFGGSDFKRSLQGGSLFSDVKYRKWVGESVSEFERSKYSYSIGQIDFSETHNISTKIYPRKIVSRQSGEYVFDRDVSWSVEKPNEYIRYHLPKKRQISYEDRPFYRNSSFSLQVESETSDFIGRLDEKRQLDRCLTSNSVNIVTVVSMGGMGKTSLINDWIREKHQNFSELELVFCWSFYKGSASQQYGMIDVFFNTAIDWFSSQIESSDCLDKDKATDEEKANKLAELIRRKTTVLFLDGIEYIQNKQSKHLINRGVVRLLCELANKNPGLCVITSRNPVFELYEYKNCLQMNLESLTPDDGAELLRQRDVSGKISDLRHASREVKGHPLTLIFLSEFLLKSSMSINERPKFKVVEDHDRHVYEHFNTILDLYIQSFKSNGSSGTTNELNALFLVSLFDRPTKDSLDHLRSHPYLKITEGVRDLTHQQWIDLKNRLVDRKLISESSEGKITMHPLSRWFFNESIKKIDEMDTWRLSHQILYRYFTEGRNSVDQHGSTNFETFYRAIYHACQADDYNKAYGILFKRDCKLNCVTAHYYLP